LGASQVASVEQRVIACRVLYRLAHYADGLYRNIEASGRTVTLMDLLLACLHQLAFLGEIGHPAQSPLQGKVSESFFGRCAGTESFSRVQDSPGSH
jgi:hypothetical protein